MSTRFQRPAGAYTGAVTLANHSKYQDDASATPRVAISSSKVDGDFNYLIAAVNALDADLASVSVGSIPDGSLSSAKLANDVVTSAKINALAVTEAKLAPTSVSNSKLVNGAVDSSKLADGAITTSKLTDGAVSTNKLADGQITTSKLADNSITYAKLQDLSATSRVLGRKTTGAGDAEECTLSEVLDMVGSAAQGDLLYRNATSWVRLPAGTSGQYLQTLGAGANLAWATVAAGAATLLATLTTTSGTTHAATGLAAARFYLIEVAGVSAGATDTLQLSISSNNGSSYGAWQDVGIASLAATGTNSGVIMVYGTNATMTKVTVPFITDGTTFVTTPRAETSVTGVINAIRFRQAAGAAFDAGTIRIYGVN